MAEIKTKATKASVTDYLASRGSPEQIADCKALMKILRRQTGEPARMWGPSIVGYGSYRYTYPSGHSGEMARVGFAIRGRDLVLYLDVAAKSQQALLGKVGKHSMGKSCFYFKRMSDLDPAVLEQLIAGSLESLERRFPD